MKIPILDLGVMAKYLLPAFIVGGIMLYLMIRGIVVYFLDNTRRTKVHKKVVELRQNPAPKAPQPTVRKTDLFAQLSAEQKKTYMLAKDLVEQKSFMEAAQLFESINFPRKAIDILENNGLVDEACSILLRMGVPYRAAIVYERNGQFLKASKYFLQDGKLDMAARNFERQAESDFHYFRQAGDCYMQAGLIDSALLAYSRLDMSEEVMRICLEKQKFEFLHRYLDLPFHAQTLLPALAKIHLEALIDALPMTPQSSISLALWTLYRPEEGMVLAALRKFSKNNELAQHYWTHLDDSFCEYICNMLPTQAVLPTAELLQVHVEALLAIGRPHYSELMREIQANSRAGTIPTLAIGL